MKKLRLVACLLPIFALTACKENKTTGSTSAASSVTKTKESSIESSDSSTKQSVSFINSSDIDDVRKETPSNDASGLRRELYQEGVNSSTLTDDDLIQFQQEAKEQGIAFKEYVKSKIK